MTDSKEASDISAIEEAQTIELLRHPIELYKILKFEGLVGSGGEAKAAIAGGVVLVNESIETQKRKKIVSGDTIRFDGTLYRVHCDAELEEPKPRTPKKTESEKEQAKPKKKDWRGKKNWNKKGRKAIGIKS